MEYVSLGASGLKVSRLTFGAMTFGEGENFRGFRSNVAQTDADRMVAAAVDAGINVFDTADLYAGGKSEVILGEAVRKTGQRESLILATKVAGQLSDDPNDRGLSYRHVIQACEASLRRLDSDWIDLYQCHSVDWTTPLDETLRALDEVVRRGWVRYIGFSNWPAWRAAEALTLQRERALAPFVSAQVYYSLVGRDLEQELLPFCRDGGLGTFIWSPLAGGFLTGKYTRDDTGGGGGRLAQFSFPPIDRERGYAVVDTVRHIAEGRNATAAQVSLAWLLAQNGVTSLIVGASRLEQLRSNVEAATLTLTADELQALERISRNEPIYPWAIPGPAATTQRRRPD
jgi:aryl-alcohol dehydrogenase-like predicted oxidoreductase